MTVESLRLKAAPVVGYDDFRYGFYSSKDIVEFDTVDS